MRCNMKTYSVLIADDDALVRKLLSRIARELQWTVEEAASGHEAIGKLNASSFHVYVLDVKMPGPSGVELAKTILQKDPTAAILILTGYADVEQAVDAIKHGVFDYVQKDNVLNEELEKTLLRAADFHEKRAAQIQAREERERSLKDIQRSNQEFQAVLESSNDLIFIVNAKSGEITDCNKTAYDRLGYTRAELVSLSFSDVVSDFHGLDWQTVFSSIRSQSAQVIEKQILTTSKRSIPVDLTFAHGCLDTGEYLAVVARDISERKKTERELDLQRQKIESQAAMLRNIIDSMDEGIILADARGTISEVNSWFLDLAKTPKEFVLQQPVGKIVQLITGCELASALTGYKSGDSVDKQIMYADVMDTRLMLTVQPIFQASVFQGVIVNLVDISDLVSEQKRAEEEIEYNRDFLSNAAQDFRSPIESIAAISSQLSETTLDESQRLLLDMIREFADSLSHLLKGCGLQTQR